MLQQIPVALLLFAFGEAWHSNHHAWPRLARFGLLPGEADPGWWFVSVLALAWNIQTPDVLPERDSLRLH